MQLARTEVSVKAPQATRAPLVAVITPAYNGAPYLRETMECVQAQTYENLIHIVLDNASTDETPRIIDDYRDGRVPIVAARNETVLPMIANWNAAFALAPENAVYLRLLCADDLMTPDSIARMVELAESRPEIGVVVCDVEKFRDDGSTIAVERTLWPAERTIVTGRDAIRAYFRNEGVILGNQALVRRSATKVRHPFFDPDIQAADGDAVLAALSATDLGIVHAPIARARMHESSQTTTFQDVWRYHHLEWFLAMLDHAAHVYSKAEWADLHGRYRRHYLRKLFKWRFTTQGRKVVRRHLEVIGRRGVRFSPLDYAIALLDWIPVKLGLKRGWTTCPW